MLIRKLLLVLSTVLIVGCTTTTSVHCPKCRKKAANFNSRVHPTDLKDRVCKVDGAYLNGYKYWFQARELSQPKMMYPATSFLIKEQGKLVWFPEEVELKE